ncbi:MAG: rRNA maturation RNase YbeY [Puniceicoccales bacterium]|nr:rRNA maturation RNase YbeY [Puniceicoccales bacterium]
MTSMTEANKSPRNVSIANAVAALDFPKGDVRTLFLLMDTTAFKIPGGDLSVAFLTADEMCRIHGKFLENDTLTDVITFPGDPAMHFAGEICVSPDCALAYHGEHGMTFSEELSLYLIHGYLHLFGLNDTSEKETVEMRAVENFCLSLLKTSDSLPKFSYLPPAALKKS